VSVACDGVPYFDVFDPRFDDFGVPAAVRGAINFKIADYREFIKLHQLVNFDMGKFQEQIKDTVVWLVKEVIANAPNDGGIPIVQIERHIGKVNALVEERIIPALRDSYGVSVTRVDVSGIEIDKSSEGYKKLQSLTQNKASVFTQAAASIVDTMGTHRTGAKRIAQTKKEEGKQVDPIIDIGEVGKNVTDAIGGAAGAIGGFFSGLGKPKEATPPPIPTVKFYAVQNGAQAGPFNMRELAELVGDGRLDESTLVWKDGMPGWEEAGGVDELKQLFGSQNEATPPPIE